MWFNIGPNRFLPVRNFKPLLYILRLYHYTFDRRLTNYFFSNISSTFFMLVFLIKFRHYGANGLIEYSAKSFCSTSTCSPESDGNTCCKRAPPASCTSIGAGITSFCQHHGGNGLAYGATTLFCETSICNVLADASTCCAPASNSATCDSISDVTSFCSAYGKLKI